MTPTYQQFKKLRTDAAELKFKAFQTDYTALMFPKNTLVPDVFSNSLSSILKKAAKSFVENSLEITNNDEFQRLLEYIEAENNKILDNLRESIRNFTGTKFIYKNDPSKDGFFANEGFLNAIGIFNQSENITETDVALVMLKLFAVGIIITVLTGLLIATAGITAAAVTLASITSLVIILLGLALINNLKEYKQDSSKTHLTASEYNNITKDLKRVRAIMIANANPDIIINPIDENIAINKPSIVITTTEGKFATKINRCSIFEKNKPILYKPRVAATRTNAIRGIYNF